MRFDNALRPRPHLTERHEISGDERRYSVHLAPGACFHDVTTRHVAAMTIQAQTTMAVRAASEIRRVLVDGLPPISGVPA